MRVLVVFYPFCRSHRGWCRVLRIARLRVNPCPRGFFWGFEGRKNVMMNARGASRLVDCSSKRSRDGRMRWRPVVSFSFCVLHRDRVVLCECLLTCCIIINFLVPLFIYRSKTLTGKPSLSKSSLRTRSTT